MLAPRQFGALYETHLLFYVRWIGRLRHGIEQIQAMSETQVQRHYRHKATSTSCLAVTLTDRTRIPEREGLRPDGAGGGAQPRTTRLSSGSRMPSNREILAMSPESHQAKHGPTLEFGRMGMKRTSTKYGSRCTDSGMIVNPSTDVRPAARADYPTQKPEDWWNRIVDVSSNAGDLVLDCFIGSGTTAAVAQKLGRRWIGCDINKGAIQTTSKRLQGIIAEQAEAARPKAQGKLLDVAEPVAHGPARLRRVPRERLRPCRFSTTRPWRWPASILGVQRTRSDRYFDGTRGKQLVKIVAVQPSR